MWKDSCEHDGVMACVDASDWWGHECVAWVPCDGWRCMEAWSRCVVVHQLGLVMMVSAWWWTFVGSSIVVPVMLPCEVDQHVVVPALPLASWSAPWVVVPLLEVQDQVELLEEVFQCRMCTPWDNQRLLVP